MGCSFVHSASIRGSSLRFCMTPAEAMNYPRPDQTYHPLKQGLQLQMRAWRSTFHDDLSDVVAVSYRAFRHRHTPKMTPTWNSVNIYQYSPSTSRFTTRRGESEYEMYPKRKKLMMMLAGILFEELATCKHTDYESNSNWNASKTLKDKFQFQPIDRWKSILMTHSAPANQRNRLIRRRSNVSGRDCRNIT